ncbi:MAG: hypothetical protein LBI69_03150 [Puniceicoccales bacterium]|nr:hypothetical protein [Puniceicoccales bacterium]
MTASIQCLGRANDDICYYERVATLTIDSNITLRVHVATIMANFNCNFLVATLMWLSKNSKWLQNPSDIHPSPMSDDELQKFKDEFCFDNDYYREAFSGPQPSIKVNFTKL